LALRWPAVWAQAAVLILSVGCGLAFSAEMRQKFPLCEILFYRAATSHRKTLPRSTGPFCALIGFFAAAKSAPIRAPYWAILQQRLACKTA
jgi:hypothetical protein